jgi:hypothetical protein
MSAPVTIPVPEEFNTNVNGVQVATGAVLSCTVTVALQVALFPLLSVTVKVTVLNPTFEQLNVEGLTVILAIPQASEDPLSTFAAVIVPFPLASNTSVNG